MSADMNMTLEQFEELAMAYGGTIARWPEHERAAAQQMLLASDAARAMLAEASALDATLDLWEAPAPSQALMARVLTDAATVSADRQSAAPAKTAKPAAKNGWFATLFGGSTGLRPAFAMACCLAVGFSLGFSGDVTIAPTDSEMAALEQTDLIDFAFAMDDESDLLFGSGALL